MIGSNHTRYERLTTLAVGIAIALVVAAMVTIAALNAQDTSTLTYSDCGILACRTPTELLTVLGVIGGVFLLTSLGLKLLVGGGGDS